jgi:hypothetical protein
MAIMTLESEYDYLPWLRYINTMMHPYKTMDYNDTIIVKFPSYYKELKNILATTPKR